MKIKFKVFTFLLNVVCVSSEIVEIDVGKVEGTLLKSRSGNVFHAFYKIPYAEPPLNELRFKAPQPVKKWNGVLDGTKPGPACYQPLKDIEMSEDCLFINVFTKNLTKSKPVMIWIHGGAFEAGGAFTLSKTIFCYKNYINLQTCSCFSVKIPQL
jgi:carboxylesterase type B